MPYGEVSHARTTSLSGLKLVKRHEAVSYFLMDCQAYS